MKGQITKKIDFLIFWHMFKPLNWNWGSRKLSHWLCACTSTNYIKCGCWGKIKVVKSQAISITLLKEKHQYKKMPKKWPKMAPGGPLSKAYFAHKLEKVPKKAKRLGVWKCAKKKTGLCKKCLFWPLFCLFSGFSTKMGIWGFDLKSWWRSSRSNQDYGGKAKDHGLCRVRS